MTQTAEEGTERPGRYPRTTGGLIGAMVVTVALVGAFVGLRAINRDQPHITPEAVDYRGAVQGLQAQGRTVVYPIELPAGWTPTSVDVQPGATAPWGIGMLTQDGRFVGIRQQPGDVRSLVATYVDKNAAHGQPVRLPGELGPAWDTWSDTGGDHALSVEPSSGPLAGDTVLVYGSAPVAEQRALISLLTTAALPAG